ncbi:methyltransferase [Priestia aryabhattai]|uniref:methyltransferase n=1 Tax=Priestia TaxID=2800373 RepID=UPI00345AE694
MSEFTQKYSKAYYLGKNNSKSNLNHGLLGYKEFNKNDVHQRFVNIFNFLKSFSSNLESKDILEIGFGRGELIPFFLKENIHSYHGIDLSKAAFKIAQKRYSHQKVKLEIREAKDLEKEASYDVIVMNHVIEHIPTFEMEVVWNKIKRILRPGGCIILRTPLFDNPNISDHTDEIHATMGMHCNKQTKGTILRSCLEHNFILAKIENHHIVLIPKKDLLSFPQNKQNDFLSTHNGELSKLGFYNQTNFSKDDLRKLVPDAGRVAIGCVTENNAKFQERTLRLVQSIRWFGGNMAGVNIFVCIVDEADPSFVDELKKWGAFVRIVTRFSMKHPPSNKLRLFELPEINSYDTIMFLDCDTVIVQDPTPYIDGQHFQAKIANGCSVSHERFKKLFKYYRLSLPKRDYWTSKSKQRTIFYCNTGVLIFPQPILQAFFPVWKKYTEDLANKPHLLKKAHFFCEQASLSLAFVKKPIPYKKLTNQMNFPGMDKTFDPVIIHYRNLVTSDGYLTKRETNPNVFLEKRIQAFNNRLRNYRKG